MKIENLRATGKRLFEELREAGRFPDFGASLGRGAGGDRTFAVDKKAEEIIISSLVALGEPLTIISEEAGIFDIGGGGRRVIIDPVDGSRNAVLGLPFYCASIAIAAGATTGDIEMSLIINLVTGDEFWAEKGSGAFLNGKRLHTQEDDEFLLVAYEAQSPGKDLARLLPLIAKSGKTRCFGATALDMAYLASGAVSVFACPSPSRSFDFAGGWLIVKEAGGIVGDIQGNDISYVELGLKRSAPLLVAANPSLRDKALKLLSEKA